MSYYQQGGESNSYQGGESNSYQGGNQRYGGQQEEQDDGYHGYGRPQQSHGYQKPDIQEAAQYAKQNAPDNDEDEGLFSSILSKVVDRDDDDDDDAPHKKQVDEHEAQQAANAHDQIYNQNNGQPGEEVSSRDMGTAAAMQAFKMFSGGGGNSNSGGSSSQLIGLAMGEAMKLFQAQGGAGGKANQGEMLQSAATMAMKLFMTQQSGNSSGGSSGGLGAVMGILGSLQGGGAAQKPSSGGGMASLLGKFL